MLTTPIDVLIKYPVRKSKKQKKCFRDAVQTYATGLGYTCTEEAGSFGTRNLVMGDPEQAKYLVTAHYDTCARMLFPNLITPCNVCLYLGYQFLLIFLITMLAIGAGIAWALTVDVKYASTIGLAAYWFLLFVMILGPANPSNANDNTSGVVTLLEIARTLPENQRDKVCFVLFDLEEAGLIGSASYRKKHKEVSANQIVLNLDCVGDGDHLVLFPTKKLRKNRKKLDALYKICGYFGRKSLLVHEKGPSVYPSDQANFPYGVGICALHKKGKIRYLSRIHTPRDTKLDETNVNILRAALTTFICCDAAQ